MKRKFAFYITNHGFGHASRNVRIIQKIFEKDPDAMVYIKTDHLRCEFLKKNLEEYKGKILYYENVVDVGFLLKGPDLEVDAERMRILVEDDEQHWEEYIRREQKFFDEESITFVISDIIAWALIAAKRSNIFSVLLCNFTWYEMYSGLLEERLCLPYLKAYQQAGKIFIYQFGTEKIEKYNANVERVSFISRKVDKVHVNEIKKKYEHPLIFVSVGKSIEMTKKFDVSDVNATFLTTVGVELEGENVIKLPDNLIATQDYIAASDYVITKGGWSTLGEIFLNRKKAAVIARGENSEDIAVMKAINENRTAVEISFEDLRDINSILKKLEGIDTEKMNCYTDDSEKIVNYIMNMALEEYE